MAEEEFERLPVDQDWDVVGITAMTATAQRAYELALLFKRNGAKVILGGIHPSVLPNEAAQFADAVVIGEAEGVWEQVLYDVQRDQLEKFYHNVQPDLSKSLLPVRSKRRSIFGLPPYIMPIMASRGCPNDCEFCCVHKVYGRKQRHIPIEKIVEDIKRSGEKLLMFLDDNIGGNRSYAMRLFECLRPLRVKWTGQALVRFILDDELFAAAVRSGLKGLFIGVESVESDALKKLRKSLPSIAIYEKAIRRCRDAGVLFHASLVFGLDEQTPNVFARTLDFLLRNSVHSLSANILTPYPGTYLYERLVREGRILHTNWSYYDHLMVSYRPKNMEPEELAEKYFDFRKQFYSYSSIVRRAWAQLSVAPLSYLGMNLAFRKTTRLYQERSRRYFRWLRQENNVTTLNGIRVPALSQYKSGGL
jgi:radical SAM superfamily enzyme YgiQ (UPF0313 family)